MENDRKDRSERTRELHTQADDERPLTRREVDVAGISQTPETVYGEDSINPNEEDQRDAERAGPGEHV
jgi:hypothetical protein